LNLLATVAGELGLRLLSLSIGVGGSSASSSTDAHIESAIVPTACARDQYTTTLAVASQSAALVTIRLPTRKGCKRGPRQLLEHHGPDALIAENKNLRQKCLRLTLVARMHDRSRSQDAIASVAAETRHAAEIAELRRSYEHQLADATVRYAGTRSHTTPDDDWKIWRKRNTGHASASTLCKILQQGDIVETSRNTVLRSERRGGAAHYIVAHRLNSALHRTLLNANATCERTWSLTLIYTDAFSSTPSNTDAPKLQATEVVVCSSKDTARRFVANLQEVGDSSAHGFVQIVLKQLEMLGLATWLSDYPPNHFALFVIVADDGPEIGRGVRLAQHTILDRSSVALCRYICFMHSLQNCQEKAMHNLDRMSVDMGVGVYTNMLMRPTNVWRSFGHHRKIRDACSDLFGALCAEAHFATCIGKVVRSRWGSLDGPERKLLRGKLGMTPSLDTIKDYTDDGGEETPVVGPMSRATADPRRRPRATAQALAICDAGDIEATLGLAGLGVAALAWVWS
jgi:hypothetical protein